MIKNSLATALCLAFSMTAMAQTDAGSSKSQPNLNAGNSKSQPNAITKCDGFVGEALNKCKQEELQGKSGEAASRSGSKEAAGRTGSKPLGASGDVPSSIGTAPETKK